MGTDSHIIVYMDDKAVLLEEQAKCDVCMHL